MWTAPCRTLNDASCKAAPRPLLPGATRWLGGRAQHRLYRTVQQPVSWAHLGPGSSDAGDRRSLPDSAAGDVSDRDSLQFLLPAHQSADARLDRRAPMVGAHASHGRRVDRSLLDDGRIVDLSRSASALDSAKATRAPFTGAQSSPWQVGFVSTLKWGVTRVRCARDSRLHERPHPAPSDRSFQWPNTRVPPRQSARPPPTDCSDNSGSRW